MTADYFWEDDQNLTDASDHLDELLAGYGRLVTASGRSNFLA